MIDTKWVFIFSFKTPSILILSTLIKEFKIFLKKIHVESVLEIIVYMH